MSASTTPRAHLSPVRVVSLLLPPLAVMVVIFVLSAQPGDGWTGLIDFSARKLAHVIEYAVLTLCWWRALRGLGVTRDNDSAIAIAVVITLAFSASDEFHQSFVDGRHGTPVDWAIDSAGAAAAALVAARRRPVAA
jgi:VanZ like family